MALARLGDEVKPARYHILTARTDSKFQRDQHWAADVWCAVASGSRTQNVLPVPGPALDAVSDPPCDCTISLAIARPNPRPPCRPSRHSSRLSKRIEDTPQDVPCNAHSAVRHRHFNVVVRSCERNGNCASRWRELGCVVQEICEHLFKPNGISPYASISVPVNVKDGKREMLICRVERRCLDCSPHGSGDCQTIELHRQLAA